ncbi:MAG: MgtC/SapB family protein [Clostridia bacterium]|nr:MgtC/SapB family protein [Clostridia bacterium]
MNETLGVILRIVLAAIAGAFIGWERASKRHSAGLRTFMVVTLGTCACMMLDMYMIKQAGARFHLLSAASLVAISSLAVNSVFYSAKNQIKGLTTSATLLVCGIIGLAIGSGSYLLAGIALAGLYITISVMPPIEEYLKNHGNHFEVQLELTSTASLKSFVTTARELGMRIDDIELNPAYVNSGLSVYSVALTIVSPELKKYKTHKEIIDALASLDYINHIEEMN